MPELKVDFTEEGSSRRHLDIELPADSLQEAFDKGVERLRKTVKLPGFRKGKIPKDVIRSRFRPDVLSDAVNDLVPKALNEALRDRNLYPIDDPQISKLESELGKPLRFRASFDVMPEIEAKDYKGIKVEAPKTTITDEQVEKGIDSLRDEHARFEPIEGRGARDGDFVVGELVESLEPDGKPERHEGVSIEVGSKSYHPALHEALQGASPGDDLEFQASFTEEHGQARAGKTYQVTFHVTELKEKVLPEADDELAKDIGDFDTLEELKAHLRKQAEEEATRHDEQELRSRLLTQLVEANPFDAPNSLVELELDSRLESLASDLYHRGIDPGKANIDWRGVRENARASAEKDVKATLLLERVSIQEKLELPDERVEQEIERIAEGVGKSAAAVRAQLNKEGGLERLRGRLKREMAVDFIKQHAKLQ